MVTERQKSKMEDIEIEIFEIIDEIREEDGESEVTEQLSSSLMNIQEAQAKVEEE